MIVHQKRYKNKGPNLFAAVIGLDLMATKLVRPPVPSSHVVNPIPRLTKSMRTHRPVSATHSSSRRRSIFGEFPSGSRPSYAIKVAEQSSGLVGDDQDIMAKEEENRTVANVKADLYQAVQGNLNSPIHSSFGFEEMKKIEYEFDLNVLTKALIGGFSDFHLRRNLRLKLW